MTDQTLHLVDGSYLFYRGLHAPMDDLTTAAGEPTKAVYLLTKHLLRLLAQHKPRHLAVAVDGPRDALHRRKLYEGYKARRGAADPAIDRQIARVKEIVRALNICLIECRGYEADDALATLAVEWISQPDRRVVLHTRDKDLMCLANDPAVVLFDPFESKWYDAAAVLAKHGVHPIQMPAFLALCGDATDGIPGVPGWGPKTAAKWLKVYKSLGRLCRSAKCIPGAASLQLRQAMADGTLDRACQLVELDRGVPLGETKVGELDFAVRPPNRPALQELFRELEFRSLLDEPSLFLEALA